MSESSPELGVKLTSGIATMEPTTSPHCNRTPVDIDIIPRQETGLKMISVSERVLPADIVVDGGIGLYCFCFFATEFVTALLDPVNTDILYEVSEL